MLYRSVLIALIMAIAPAVSIAVSAEVISQNNPVPTPPINNQVTNLDRGFNLVIDARDSQKRGEFSQSLQLFAQAIAIFQKEGDVYAEARTYNFVGNLYLEQKESNKAIANYQEAFKIISTIQPKESQANLQVRSEEALILQNLGFAFNQANNWQKSIETYELALEKSRIIKNQDREAIILNNIGQIYVAIGKFSRGIEVLQSALAVRQSNNDVKNTGGVLLNIGFAYRRLGQFEKALDFYQKALTVVNKYGDRKVETSILNNIAGIYRSLGKYSQALTQYKASLELSQNLNLPRQAAITLSNIGAVYNELGQLDNALQYFQQALSQIQKIGDRQSESVFLSNIGLIYDNKGKRKQALDYYTRALQIHQELKDLPAQGITLNNIGEVYRVVGLDDKAIASYQQSLEILREIGDLSASAVTLSNLGRVYASTKRYFEALNNYQQAAAIHQQLGERRGESIVLSNLGDLFADKLQPELAILFYKRSVNIREALRQEVRSLSIGEQKTYTSTVEGTYRDLANLLLKQNRVLEAQQVLDLLKVQELDDYLKNVRGNGETAKGIELLESEQRFFVDYSAIQNRYIQAGKDSLDIYKFTPSNRSLEQKQRLRELVSLQESASRQLSNYVQSPAVSSILKQIGQSGDRASNLANLQQFTDLQKNLQQFSQKTAIFYPLVLDDRLELIVVTANGNPIRRTVSVKKEQLNQAIVDFRTNVQDAGSFDVLSSAQQLHTWLIQPIADDLQKAGVQTIIYAPDGQLRYLPIAALHDGKQWLVERYAINTITAASLTNLGDRPNTSLDKSLPRVLAGAFTTGKYVFDVNGKTFDFSGLPFAGKEVESLVKKLPNSVKFVDSAFSVNSTVAKFKQYNIIHLATHAAFVTGKPEDSFIMFGDGSRASLRDVSTWSLKNVDLVILSACETGLGGKLGNGTEIMGFGYQMEYAGAKAAIASLWQVSDGGTQTLMEAFYNVLQDPQLTKTEVLAKAQRSMINQKSTDNSQSFNHPYFWSPFIIIGNGLL